VISKSFSLSFYLSSLILFVNLCIGSGINPYDKQINNLHMELKSSQAPVRAGAAESLGYLRSYRSGDFLAQALDDPGVAVRRQAAMSLAWCGGRNHIDKLIQAMQDKDWMVRQGAWVSLTNLTGMKFPFDAIADDHEQQRQVRMWRQWWDNVPQNDAPRDIYKLIKDFSLADENNYAFGSNVTSSTTYRGPVSVLTDGDYRGVYWQTKNVPFPQYCTVELEQPREIGCVIVYQYGKNFCMTDYELSVSMDGRTFEKVIRKKEKSPPKLIFSFPPRKAKYVRIISHGTENPTYPTTFFEIEIRNQLPESHDDISLETRYERAIRALGVLGGKKASAAIINIIKPYMNRSTDDFAQKSLVQAALRSLGRLGDTYSVDVLLQFLNNPKWARYAADALGDCPCEKVCKSLIEAYPKYSRDLNRKNPKLLPRDDYPSLEPADRMYETPYAISVALSRMPWDNTDNLNALRDIIPLIAANIPSDFDGGMLYEPEAHQVVNAYLFEVARMRQVACEAIFKTLSEDYDHELLNTPVGKELVALSVVDPGDIPFAATWISTLCVNKEYVPRLINLLKHENGWVRINAAKALMFMDAKQAITPIGEILVKSKPEGEYGYFGKFIFNNSKKQGQAEYDDPPPRWRQAYIRALGRLGATEYVPLLVKILFDDKNVLEVQQAALLALEQLNTPQALKAIGKAEQSHPFHSIKVFAREMLWRQGKLEQNPDNRIVQETQVINSEPDSWAGKLEGFVFIKGDNNMPNDFQIDIWRQTYSTTDSGPTYRMGENLFVLYLTQTGGKVRQLTNFQDGYVADCEVSYDGKKVVFARRGGEDNPWWHIWCVNADGSRLQQLTFGPYHDR